MSKLVSLVALSLSLIFFVVSCEKPQILEICDGIDNNGDGVVDEGCESPDEVYQVPEGLRLDAVLRVVCGEVCSLHTTAPQLPETLLSLNGNQVTYLAVGAKDKVMIQSAGFGHVPIFCVSFYQGDEKFLLLNEATQKVESGHCGWDYGTYTFQIVPK